MDGSASVPANGRSDPSKTRASPSRRGPHYRRPILVVAVAAGMVVAGVVVWATLPSDARAARQIVVTFEPSVFIDEDCPYAAHFYFGTVFRIASISGNLTTADFGLSIINRSGGPIPPDDVAPLPTPSFPCGAPFPTGWYALFQAPHGAAATFPAGDGGWSNATTEPIAATVGAAFLVFTVGDPTGSGDQLNGFGIDGAPVTFAGNTTFPAYSNP